MKLIYKTIPFLVLGVCVSCNDYLDRDPLTDVTPEQYFNTEGDLADYTLTRYTFPTHINWDAGTFTHDNGTDNQAGVNPSIIWKKDEWRVPANNSKRDGNDNDNDTDYTFNKIREINYFLAQVEPKAAQGQITGNATNINHYIGEAYFLRAYEYFKKLVAFGDYPIITEVLKDDKEILTAAASRKPRNEVARFILSDLDKAISLLKPNPVSGKNRISREVAHLFRSRVALFEGTWLKYHQGTAFVPGGTGWPGAAKNPGFTINISSEIDFFLTEAMNSAKIVADGFQLVRNDHKTSTSDGVDYFNNPYFKMFADLNMSEYSEVLLWRQYKDVFVGHHTMHYLNSGAGTGYTKGFMDSFLMKNGLPIYASGSGYLGDDTFANVEHDRDERLQLFLTIPGDYITANHRAVFPALTDKAENRAVTGYNIGKGLYNDDKFLNGANPTETGSIVFRAAEAYLNYIEASYEKNGSIDAVADDYWKKIRTRAGVSDNYMATIAATDLNQENDWAVYSAGNRVSPTLYNIRRERRNEFIAEGMRMNDLKRWKALDQVNNYQIEGFNLWTSNYQDNVYYEKDAAGNIKLDTSGNPISLLITEPSANPVVSSRALSNYVRPYQIRQANNLYYNGLTWTQAHYLAPIPYNNFLIASNGDANQSSIYQNPGWPIQSGAGAL